MKTRQAKSEQVPEIEWYDSMTQASSGLSIPLDELKRAKAAGCPHFRGSRIHCAVMGWILENPPAPVILDKEKLECERIEKINRKLDFEHQIKMEKYILRDDVKEGWSKGLEIIMRIMQNYLDRTPYNAAIKEMKRELTAMDL